MHCTVKFVLSCGLVSIIFFSKGQTKSQLYNNLIKNSVSLYLAKDYKGSALSYSKAFELNPCCVNADDRYNSACSWALANNQDSAFQHLNLLATKLNYHNYSHIINDRDLNSLHNDRRWTHLLSAIKQNELDWKENYLTAIAVQLDTIYNTDQKYRRQWQALNYQKQGNEELIKLINKSDSINLIKVKLILNRYGWLGPERVGASGSAALFLVIQHSDKETRRYYLPMMRAAVKNKNALAKDLALLEDRTSLDYGKKQIYGSQLGRDEKTQKYYVKPLDDPDNVDKRRAKIGLETMAEYLSLWGIHWDLEKFKEESSKLNGYE